MNLQWLMDNVSNKVIKIDSLNSEGEWGMTVNLVVTEAEIEKTIWSGYKLTINGGNIILYFDDYKFSNNEDIGLSNSLDLCRSDEETVNIYLPEGDNWDIDTKVGYFAKK